MDFESMYKKMEEEAAAPDRYKTAPAFERDSRFYKISKDADGNGTVVVRFLPSFNTDKTALNTYVLKKVHALQWEKHFPGKDKPEKRWKPEFMCPKTISKEHSCPVCDYGWDMYNELKDSGEVKDKYDAYRRAFTNSEKLITNILVVKDELHPENNGKVFLFELSKTVLGMFPKEVEKVKEMTDDDKKACGCPTSMNVFDPFNIMASKNIVLKFKDKKFVTTPADYWGSSYFAASFSSIATSIDEAKKIVEQAYCLDEHISENLIRSHEEMVTDLDFVTFKTEKKEPKEPKEKKVDEEPKYEAPKENADMNALLLKTPTQAEEIATQQAPVQTPVEEPKKSEAPQASTSAKELSDEEFLASLGM